MSSLRFILGTAAYDHRASLLAEMKKQMVTDPNGEFFYLVPNHIKFATEIEVLNRLKDTAALDDDQPYAQMKVQVLSFSRLAWYLLRDTPAFQAPRLSPTGLTMLTAQIVNQHQNEMQMFAGEVKRPGFIKELTQQLTELQTAKIAPTDYAAIIERAKTWAQTNHQVLDDVWQAKLKVIFMVYGEFVKALGDYQDISQIDALLVKYLQQKDLSHAYFYLDRFSQFTARELQIVQALIKNAQATTISLILDRPYHNELPDEHNLFYESGCQYYRLVRFAKQTPGVKLADDLMADQPRVNEDLQVLERVFAAQTQMLSELPIEPLKDPKSIQFFTASNRVAELNLIAAKIRQLVSTGKYRYRDFLILTRHLDGYATMLDSVFKAHEVPIFNDLERLMNNHPLVNLIEALFKVYQRHFATSDVMHLLKTGLLVPKDMHDDLGRTVTKKYFQNAIYQTENWCLQYGRTGDDWLSKQKWHFDPNVDEEELKHHVDMQKRDRLASAPLNVIKDYVNGLQKFFNQLDQAQNGTEAAKALYSFLVGAGVVERLQEWSVADSQIDLTRAQEPQQVWQVFCNILDEYVQILGQQQPFMIDEFADLLMAGFETAQYSQIPSTLDQVVISETGIVQTDTRKVVFMMGATSDVMPEAKSATGLLSDPDRELLNACLSDEQFLPASGVEKMSGEPFLNYLGFMSGKERLIISAPQLGNDEKPLSLSPYMIDLAMAFDSWDADKKQLKDDLPFMAQPQDSALEAWPYVSAPAAVLGNLMQVLRQALDDRQPLGAAWSFLSKLMAQNLTRYDWTAKSLEYANETTPLPAALAERLYGQWDPEALDAQTQAMQNGQPLPQTAPKLQHNTLYASISQLQDYYRNPYEYFLKYGLRIQKREELEISADKSGTFFHDSLDCFMRLLNQQNLQLSELNDDQLQHLTHQAMAWAFDQQPQLIQLMQNYQRLAFRKRQLERLVETMTKVLRNQAKLTHAQNVVTEQKFGVMDLNDQGQHSFAPLIYPLDQGHKVYLRGRIDRIDAVELNQEPYLMVVDYKSGNQQFNLVEAYDGLALQMLSYLNSLSHQLKLNQQTAKIAGALYLHLQNPVFKWESLSGSLASEELKSHRYRGVLLNDRQLLSDLDRGIDDFKPQLLSLRAFKNGNLKASSGMALVDEKQLAALLARNQERIVNAATQIFNGDTALRPYRLDKQDGLQYSDYQDIYRFDPMLDQKHYRDILLTERDVAEKLKQDQSQGDKNE